MICIQNPARELIILKSFEKKGKTGEGKDTFLTMPVGR